jgi:hypothetical protein
MAERARASATKKRKAKAKRNGLGHNSSGVAGPSDDLKRHWLSKVNVAEAAYDRAAEIAKKRKSELANVYQGAKDDGCNTEGLKNARKLNKRDRLEVAADYTATGDWLRIMDSPLVQLDLFKTPDWPEPVSANLQGYRIGKAGGDVVSECPYEPGTDAFVAFRAGYDTGQQENQQSLRDA